ncbi:helix-turn-helix domain-containing protein [Hydrogeniiclostridium mannosilyticum]|uniref:helix-turn-helix domain-containing protein n=1 Tax=Hydrogeniiclostridium mannosilyticum TaxID=2764322 RepID=UPI003999C53D
MRFKKIEQWIIRNIPLGKNIKFIRKSKHLTQKDVTTKLQLMGSYMSEDTLSNIETGRRNIKANDLKALKIIFDVDYEEFFKE